MAGYDPQGWTDFAGAVAGASAALVGLLFVAVSINLRVILSNARTPSRAAQALIMLVTPVFLSLCLLVPGQGRVALGVELIVVAVLAGPVSCWLTRPGVRSAEQPIVSWIAIGLVPSAVLLLGPLVAGIGIANETLGGLYWLPVTVAVALLGGLINAWVLLVEVVR